MEKTTSKIGRQPVNNPTKKSIPVERKPAERFYGRNDMGKAFSLSEKKLHGGSAPKWAA